MTSVDDIVSIMNRILPPAVELRSTHRLEYEVSEMQ